MVFIINSVLPVDSVVLLFSIGFIKASSEVDGGSIDVLVGSSTVSVIEEGVMG